MLCSVCPRECRHRFHGRAPWKLTVNFCEDCFAKRMPTGITNLPGELDESAIYVLAKEVFANPDQLGLDCEVGLYLAAPIGPTADFRVTVGVGGPDIRVARPAAVDLPPPQWVWSGFDRVKAGLRRELLRMGLIRALSPD